jgi:ATP-dependent DNA helicase RecG
MKEGFSKIRNKALAHAFLYMNMIEEWGSGIPKLIEEMKQFGLKEPEFIDMDIGFRVNLYRTNSELNSELNSTSSEEKEKEIDWSQYDVNATQVRILKAIAVNPKISARVISQKIGMTQRAVEKNIRELKQKKVLVRHGSPRYGEWEIIRQ